MSTELNLYNICLDAINDSLEKFECFYCKPVKIKMSSETESLFRRIMDQGINWIKDDFIIPQNGIIGKYTGHPIIIDDSLDFLSILLEAEDGENN